MNATSALCIHHKTLNAATENVSVSFKAFLTALAFSMAASGCSSSGSPSPNQLTAEKLSSVSTELATYVESGRLAGFATLVAHRGKIVDLQTVGVSDIETRQPIAADTIMRTYSMTKPVTSAAVMVLVERGRLSLDDPLEKYIPSFSNLQVYTGETDAGEIQTVPANKPITIRHLLTHTSGLTYGIAGDTAIHKMYDATNYMKLDFSLDQFAEKIAKIPLVFQPGEKFNYSVSTSILGRVIEVVSGVTLGEFIAENITGPLGMKDTGFYVPHEKLDRFADLNITDENGELVVYDDNQTGGLSGAEPLLQLGGGGLVSTLADYYRFCQMILNKGELDGVRILQPSTVELMTTNQLPAGDPSMTVGTLKLDGVGFGYGFAVTENPSLLISRATSAGDLWWGGYSTTLFWIDPREQIVGVLMAQQLPSATAPSLRLELRSKFRQIVYKALKD